MAAAKKSASQSLDARLKDALALLERRGSKRNRDGMARYGIVAKKVFGVSVAQTRLLAKQLGRDHDLAAALWKSGWLEARMLATFVEQPERVTPAQMDRWCRDFDNWAICDTVCFHLFDKTSHGFNKVRQWAVRREEFVKRGGFALLASLALHDKQAPDEAFLRALPLVERGASDERNFVKKGVSWALRSVGHRNLKLHAAAMELAQKLADSDDSSARWIGKDVIRDLARPMVKRKAKAASG